LAAFGDASLTFIADVCLALGAAPSSADFINSIGSGSKTDAIVPRQFPLAPPLPNDAATKCVCLFATEEL
jgi:hypothetical protein